MPGHSNKLKTIKRFIVFTFVLSENRFYDFLFASLDGEVHPSIDLFLKEKNLH